jgi:copper(I)-binding protein
MDLVRSCACALFALVIFCTGSTLAQELKAGDLVLNHAWARATPSGAAVGGAFLTIKNMGTTPDKLVGGSTPVGQKIEMHETATKDGVATMRPVLGGLSIPPGRTVTLAPGGYHIMIIGLNAPLKEGDHVPMTLQFEKAGKVDITLDVQGIGALGPTPNHGDHIMPGMQPHMKMN